MKVLAESSLSGIGGSPSSNNRMPLRMAMGCTSEMQLVNEARGEELADDRNGSAHADGPLARLLLECSDGLDQAGAAMDTSHAGVVSRSAATPPWPASARSSSNASLGSDRLLQRRDGANED